MRVIVLLFSILQFQQLSAQDLKNTEWTQIKIERKDGSRVFGGLEIERSISKYYFRDNTVLITVNNLFSTELTYSVNHDILSIGEMANYQIDRNNSDELVITQIPKDEMPDDKLNRQYFVSRHSLFQYLKDNEKLNITGDTLIDFNPQFAPTYYADLSLLIRNTFDNIIEDRNLSGSCIINSKGSIENLQFEENRKFSKREILKITESLNATNGSWVIPEAPHPYKYKINFAIQFSYFRPMSSVGFNYVYKSLYNTPKFRVPPGEFSQANNYFIKGNDLLKNEKYEDATQQYIKCIKSDSLYIDAYYNLAYCYEKAGNKELACETWNILKMMGQRRGEYLHDQICK